MFRRLLSIGIMATAMLLARPCRAVDAPWFVPDPTAKTADATAAQSKPQSAISDPAQSAGKAPVLSAPLPPALGPGLLVLMALGVVKLAFRMSNKLAGR